MKALFRIATVCAALIPAAVASAQQFSFHAYWEVERGRSHEAVVAGVSHGEYQAAFDTFSDEVEPFVVDGYDLEGQAFMNVIFRTPTGKPWIARHAQTSQQYQTQFDEHVADGDYCLRWVDSYLSNNRVRYAFILTQHRCQAQVAYHGLTASQHQARFNQLTADGWDPINISVVSINEQRFYTAFYEQRSGSFASRSFLTRDQFGEFAQQQTAAGRKLAYVNAYTHDQGRLPRFVAIYRSNLSSAEFLPNVDGRTAMEAGEEKVSQGYFTRVITGFGMPSDGGHDGHRFETVWYRPQRAGGTRPGGLVRPRLDNLR
ncbi:MAG: hypothetical protein AAFV72_09470 [Cyanobacteria bacterium J06635_1]